MKTENKTSQTSEPAIAVEPVLEVVPLVKGTLRWCEIKVGEKVPSEANIAFDGGSMAMNLGSWYFDMLMQDQLAKLQSEKYEFSEICRNENERKAFYLAIQENAKESGYEVKVPV
jgi:hypothetical protein